jgi:hypothetical protein
MKKLCEKDDDAKLKDESTIFCLEELWNDANLSTVFTQEQIAPLAIRFFQDDLGYIKHSLMVRLVLSI